MKNVCIAGVGLIGGSLGMALRKKYHVTGWGRSVPSLRTAKRKGAIDDFSSAAAQAVSKADIVVLCVPVQHIGSTVRKLQPHLKKGAVVTDVGSVKVNVVNEVRPILKKCGVPFVGGHPVAGSEKAGVENARKDLFRKATVVLSREGAPLAAFEAIKKMWEVTGAHCIAMSARDHDRVLGLTSHLPHLLAFALFSLTRTQAHKQPLIRSLVAGSFRDMTRIAASDPDVWTGILKMNRNAIKQATADFLKVLNRLISTPTSHIGPTLRSITNAKKSW